VNVTPTLRPALLGALLGLHLVSQAAPAAPATPAEIRFDTTPVAGQQQRQQVDMQARMKMRVEAAPQASDEQRAKVAQVAERMAQTGDIKMAMQMRHTSRVGQPDAEGWLPLSFVASDRKTSIEVGGKPVPLPANAMTDMSITARFNPKDFAFEVKNIEGGGAGAQQMLTSQGQAMLADAFKLHKALAQRALKIGESVDVPLSMTLPVPLPGGAGGLQGQVHYTLVRVERGVAYFDLAMTMNVKVDTPLPQPAQAASAASTASAPDTQSPPPMLHMTMDGTGKGTSALRLTDRLPLSTQMSMDMKMTMDGPDNARMLMDMVMDMQSKGEALGIRQAPAKKKS